MNIVSYYDLLKRKGHSVSKIKDLIPSLVGSKVKVYVEGQPRYEAIVTNIVYQIHHRDNDIKLRWPMLEVRKRNNISYVFIDEIKIMASN